MTEKNFDRWCAIIRTAALSSAFPLTMWELNRTVAKLEGQDIPFKRFHFLALKDMLRKVPGFKVFQYRGRILVRACPLEGPLKSRLSLAASRLSYRGSNTYDKRPYNKNVPQYKYNNTPSKICVPSRRSRSLKPLKNSVPILKCNSPILTLPISPVKPIQTSDDSTSIPLSDVKPIQTSVTDIPIPLSPVKPIQTSVAGTSMPLSPVKPVQISVANTSMGSSSVEDFSSNSMTDETFDILERSNSAKPEKRPSSTPKCDSSKRTRMEPGSIRSDRVNSFCLNTSSTKESASDSEVPQLTKEETESPIERLLNDSLASNISESLEVNAVHEAHMNDNCLRNSSYTSLIGNIELSSFSTSGTNMTPPSPIIPNSRTSSEGDIMSVTPKKDFNYWSSVLRARTLFAKPIDIWELNHITKLFESEDIPFKQFDFDTLEDMLRMIPELKVFEQDGKTVVQAIPPSFQMAEDLRSSFIRTDINDKCTNNSAMPESNNNENSSEFNLSSSRNNSSESQIKSMILTPTVNHVSMSVPSLNSSPMKKSTSLLTTQTASKPMQRLLGAVSTSQSISAEIMRGRPNSKLIQKDCPTNVIFFPLSLFCFFFIVLLLLIISYNFYFIIIVNIILVLVLL